MTNSDPIAPSPIVPDRIAPFSIDIPESELDDLRSRISNVRWPDTETVDDWSQGMPLAYTRELADHWANGYDWRACESRLNAHPNFVASFDDLDIHFLHVESPHADATPLCLTHGWPGSVVEFLNVIGPLTDPTNHGGDEADAFHLVIPALPGFGFSGKPAAAGCGTERIADMWAGLMQSLGYESFGAQGGDWGSAVTTQIGARHLDRCIGIHLNMPIGRPTPEQLGDMDDTEQAAMAALTEYTEWDSGYSKQQSTRPQTLGYGLADSPVGQMAWIVEKFWRWTDNNGHPEDSIGRDQLLDNVMMYWLTNSAASSARLYWESFSNFGAGQVDIPMGGSVFPKEIIRTSRRWAANGYSNITWWNELDRGGHFAAFEVPELFVSEVRSFFATIR